MTTRMALLFAAMLALCTTGAAQAGITEACCYPDGSCKDVNTSFCIETAGNPQGPETDCAGVSCPFGDTQACCFGDGSCFDVNPGACEEKGGIPQGPKTFCGKVPCDIGGIQACCYPDGSCEEIDVDTCLMQGGDPQGPQSFCGGGKEGDGKIGGGGCPFPCGEPGSGSCFEVHGNPSCDDETCCNIVCSLDPFCCDTEWDELCVDEAFESCPGAPPAGACCITVNECLFGTEATCIAAGGNYLGDGTDCPQIILVVNHNGPQDQWSHTIELDGDCPVAGGDGPGCSPGPFHVDPWVTSMSAGSNCENFGHPDACPIPADFFGPGSDPFSGTACFEGAPIGMTDLGFGPIDFGQADTLVRRDTDPFDRCDLPSVDTVTVPIELVQLSLVSVAPITVTFNGGQDPEDWDVAVSITPGSTQPGGTLTATKTHCNGGEFDSTLAACPTFTFTKVSDPQQQFTLEYCTTCDAGGIVMVSSTRPWVHDLGDNIGEVSPVCTNFNPGIQELNPQFSCDCNANESRDKCDIEAGVSFDCDLDGGPDECQVPAPCLADITGNCEAGFADILQVIAAWGPCGAPCDEDLNDNGEVDFADIMVIIDNYGPCGPQ